MSVISYTFPAAAICFVLLLYTFLRRQPLEAPSRAERHSAPPLLIITAVYAATAFCNLGDTAAPRRFQAFSARQTIELELSGQEELGAIWYYTGLNTGSYSVAFSEDGETFTQAASMPQAYADLFKWKTAERTENAPHTARYVRITADAAMELGELALFRADGTRIAAQDVTVPAGADALFDEQELVPAASSYRNSTYFDEIYHARTAYEHLRNVEPYEVSHPPLGKLILSIGVALFGMTPFGWRFMGTLFGVLMLPALWELLRRMFRDQRITICGTLLFAFDFMHFTQTRIATIDTYAVFFILLMYLFFYRYLTERKAWCLALSGVFFGLGAASKWTCLYAGAGLGVLWLLDWAFRAAAARRDGAWRDYADALLKNIGLCLIFFVALPCAIYYVSYYPYGTAAGLGGGARMLCSRGYARIVFENQKFMFTYHSGLVATHPYSARWWQWLLDIRPILYYLGYGENTVSSIAAFVNPLLCWGGLLSLPVLAVRAARDHSRRALFVLVGYLAQVLPWVFISRLTFEYHYFPATVFLTLGLCEVFDLLRRRGALRWAYAFTGAGLVLFAAFYPVLSGMEVSRNYAWYFLKWFPSWPF